MYFNISDIKTYNIDESYKQCFSNIKNSVEYSLAIDYMLERFDKNIVKEICSAKFILERGNCALGQGNGACNRRKQH